LNGVYKSQKGVKGERKHDLRPFERIPPFPHLFGHVLLIVINFFLEVKEYKERKEEI